MKTYFQNLDGWRVVVSVVVVFQHANFLASPNLYQNEVLMNFRLAWLAVGPAALSFFFCLSGFLITYLMIREKETTGRLNLRQFWFRRSLRILPVYFLGVLLGFTLFPYVLQRLNEPLGDAPLLWSYLAFAANLTNLYFDLEVSEPLGVLWTIAVEWQFYMLWSAIVWALSVRWLGWAAAGLAAASMAARHYYQDQPGHLEFNTLCVLVDVAVGCWGAYACARWPRFLHFFEAMPRWGAVLGYLALAGWLGALVVLRASPVGDVWGRALPPLLFLFLILEQNYCRQSFFKMGRWAWLSYAGRYTYSLYVFHVYVLFAIARLFVYQGLHHRLFWGGYVEPVLGFFLSLAAAAVVYHLIEEKALRWKDWRKK